MGLGTACFLNLSMRDGATSSPVGHILSRFFTSSFPTWLLSDKNAPVQKLYNGHLRLTGYRFIDAYENSNSSEFANLAAEVRLMVRISVSHVEPQGNSWIEAQDLLLLCCVVACIRIDI